MAGNTPKRGRDVGAQTMVAVKRIVLLAAIVLGTLLVAADPSHATARSPGVSEPGTPPADGSVLHAPSNPISLTEAQRARIAEILEESRAGAQRLKAELEDARGDLKRELDQREPVFDDVMREVDRVGALETNLRKHQIATLMNLRALLSQDQLSGLTQLFEVISHNREGDAPGLPARPAAKAEPNAASKPEPKTEPKPGSNAGP